MVPKRYRLAVLGAVGGIVALGAAGIGGIALAQTPSGGSSTSAAATPSAPQQQPGQTDNCPQHSGSSGRATAPARSATPASGQ
jgi:hypothetical protein